MALEAVVPESTFETLDDSLKTFYVQNTDTKDYYLDVSGADRLAVNLQTEKAKLAENNQKLTDQLAKERKQREELAAEVAAAKSKGKPDDDLAAKLAELEAQNKSYSEALESEKKARETIAAQNARSLREAEIAKVMAKFQMVPTAAANLREATAVKEENGQYSVQVIDPATQQPVLVAAQPVSLENLVAGWQQRSEYRNLFQANGAGGTGAPGRQGKPATGKTISRSEYNSRAVSDPGSIKTFFAEGGKVIDD